MPRYRMQKRQGGRDKSEAPLLQCRTGSRVGLQDGDEAARCGSPHKRGGMRLWPQLKGGLEGEEIGSEKKDAGDT